MDLIKYNFIETQNTINSGIKSYSARQLKIANFFRWISHFSKVFGSGAISGLLILYCYKIYQKQGFRNWKYVLFMSSLLGLSFWVTHGLSKSPNYIYSPPSFNSSSKKKLYVFSTPDIPLGALIRFGRISPDSLENC